MIQVQTTNIVTAVDYAGDPRLRYQSGGITEELRAISNLLKEALDGVGAWIQLFGLMSDPSLEFSENAARELNRVSEYFAAAYARLMHYQDLLPQPRDMPIAVEMAQILEKLLRLDMPKATLCEIEGFGWTSWGDRIDPLQNTKWTAEMLQQVFLQIKSPSWHLAREIISEARIHLP
jgi:hypothetical protein